MHSELRLSLVDEPRLRRMIDNGNRWQGEVRSWLNQVHLMTPALEHADEIDDNINGEAHRRGETSMAEQSDLEDDHSEKNSNSVNLDVNSPVGGERIVFSFLQKAFDEVIHFVKRLNRHLFHTPCHLVFLINSPRQSSGVDYPRASGRAHTRLVELLTTGREWHSSCTVLLGREYPRLSPLRVALECVRTEPLLKVPSFLCFMHHIY